MNDWQVVLKRLLRGNATPPLCDVIAFEINNKNCVLLIDFICTIFDYYPCSLFVEENARNLWVTGSKINAPFGANVIKFDFFKTVVVIIF